MFASFLLPSIFEGEPARHLQVFYDQLSGFGRDNVAFIGQPDYFRPPAEFQAEGRAEWKPEVLDTFRFTPPTDLDGVEREVLAEDLFAPWLRGHGSSWRLYGRLMRSRFPALEGAFAAALDRLRSRRPVEAVLSFVGMPSLRRVSRALHLPFVQCEYGPLRPPCYAMTGYWNLRRSTLRVDAEARLRRFRRELAASHVELLGRDELLSLLRRTPMPALPELPDAPYRIGIALQGDDLGYAAGISQLDLHSMARRHARGDEILIRHHPATRTYCSPLLGTPDDSRTTAEFIGRCSTVLTVSSGTALEALLLDRRCVVVGDSAFALAADRTLDARTIRSDRERLLRLNFLVLSYIVPFDLMFDPDYSRWRLGNPPELDIARTHRRWHATRIPPAPHLGVDESTGEALLRALPRSSRSSVAVFGAGTRTRALLERLRSTRFEPTAVFDNDPSKWGTRIDDIVVQAPAYLDGAAVVVASWSYADEMVRQLLALGYPSERLVRVPPAAA